MSPQLQIDVSEARLAFVERDKRDLGLNGDAVRELLPPVGQNGELRALDIHFQEVDAGHLVDVVQPACRDALRALHPSPLREKIEEAESGGIGLQQRVHAEPLRTNVKSMLLTVAKGAGEDSCGVSETGTQGIDLPRVRLEGREPAQTQLEQNLVGRCLAEKTGTHIRNVNRPLAHR